MYNFKSLTKKQLFFIIFSLITFTFLIVYSAYTITDFVKYLNLIPFLDKIESNENIRILIENAYKHYAINSSVFICAIICFFITILIIGINIYFNKLEKIFANDKFAIIILSIVLILSTLITLHFICTYTIDTTQPDKDISYLFKNYLPTILILFLNYISLVFISIKSLINKSKNHSKNLQQTQNPPQH